MRQLRRHPGNEVFRGRFGRHYAPHCEFFFFFTGGRFYIYFFACSYVHIFQKADRHQAASASPPGSSVSAEEQTFICYSCIKAFL